jgi:transcriptional regulator with XRE-family HTH domain
VNTDREQLSGYRLRDYDYAIAALRQAWLTRGPKQSALARRMGCSRSQVAAWLAGECGAGPRRLFALADALGFDLALIPREPPPRPLGLRADGTRRCSQPGHNALGCACPETLITREDAP